MLAAKFYPHPTGLHPPSAWAPPLTGRKSEAFSPMGSFRVAGMMADSALGAGVEVTTGGRDRTSSWRGLGLSRWPAQGLFSLPPSQPPSPARAAPAPIQDSSPSLSPTPCPLHLDILLAPGTARPWLGWALLPPWLWPRLEAEGKDQWVRSGQEKGRAGRRQGLGWGCGRHL